MKSSYFKVHAETWHTFTIGMFLNSLSNDNIAIQIDSDDFGMIRIEFEFNNMDLLQRILLW